MSEKNEKIDIRKIAEEAGVAISTVSKVINDYTYVSDETRARVTQVIEKYNYSPQYFGRALSKKKSETIGLLIPYHFSPASFYFSEIFKGIVDEASDKDYSILLPPYNKVEYRRLFSDRRIEGAIFIAPPTDDSNIQMLLDENSPFVLVNSAIGNAPRVDIDNNLAMRKVLSHLYELGHRKIAFLAGYLKSPDAQERYDAYLGFMKEKNIEVSGDWVIYADYIEDKAYTAVKTLFSAGGNMPTAIAASNDDMAAGAVKALKELEIGIPERVSVTGFDDSEVSRRIEPELTTVRQPFRELGRNAVDLLVDIIGNAVSARKVILKSKLVIRDSTGKTCNS